MRYYMSPLFRDPHPTCTRCRGRSCSYNSTCDTCDGWSLDQWEHCRLKRAYAGRINHLPAMLATPLKQLPTPIVPGLHEVRFSLAS